MSRAADSVSRRPLSLVQVLAVCWRRPSLTLLEVGWRWLFGIPALVVLYQGLRQLVTPRLLNSIRMQEISLLQPWKAAVVLSDLAAILLPRALGYLLWVGPWLLLAWVCISGLGRNLVLRRYDPSLPWKPLQMVMLQALRVVCLGGVFAVWYGTVKWAAATWVLAPAAQGQEPNVLGYLITIIFSSLALFSLWSLLSWVVTLAPVLVLAGNMGVGQSLVRSLMPGRRLMGRVVEANLVLGIVKLALLVLAMVFSATPMPFSSVVTGQALGIWWAVVTVLYFVANDYFQVGRLAAFVEFWRETQRADGPA